MLHCYLINCYLKLYSNANSNEKNSWLSLTFDANALQQIPRATDSRSPKATVLGPLQCPYS